MREKKIYYSKYQGGEISNLDSFKIPQNNEHLNGFYADYDNLHQSKSEQKTLKTLDDKGIHNSWDQNIENNENEHVFYSKNGTKVKLDRRIYKGIGMIKDDSLLLEEKEKINEMKEIRKNFKRSHNFLCKALFYIF